MTAAKNGVGVPVGEDAGLLAAAPAPVTIAYIAESAGVSVPTVSKVLNGRSGVSHDTRAVPCQNGSP